MAKTKAAFEKSRFDKDTKDAPEGSAKDMAKDKKAFPAFLKNKAPSFKRGGKVK